MPEKYELRRDPFNRVQTDIADDLTVGIKILSETDQRRVERGTHAYCVLDLRTSFGPVRIRDIRVQWSERNQCHFIRWRQWSTGRIRNDRKEYLDVAGPLDPETRTKFANAILDVFTQIKEEAASGTLGRKYPELEELKKTIESAQDTATAITASVENAQGVLEDVEFETETATVQTD